LRDDITKGEECSSGEHFGNHGVFGEESVVSGEHFNGIVGYNIYEVYLLSLYPKFNILSLKVFAIFMKEFMLLLCPFFYFLFVEFKLL